MKNVENNSTIGKATRARAIRRTIIEKTESAIFLHVTYRHWLTGFFDTIGFDVIRISDKKIFTFFTKQDGLNFFYETSDIICDQDHSDFFRLVGS